MTALFHPARRYNQAGMNFAKSPWRGRLRKNFGAGVPVCNLMRIPRAREFNIGQTEYNALHKRSLESRDEFWKSHADGIDWFHRFDAVLDQSNSPFLRWFPNGRLNVCYNAVDRWVERGFGDQSAVLYDSPATGTSRKLSFKELLESVSRFAGGLRDRGVCKGDRVVIYCPMIPETVVAMLACARIGAIHSVVFGGFSSTELAKRIDDSTPKALITASCGVEPTRVVPYEPIVKEALQKASHTPPILICKHRHEIKMTENIRHGKEFEDFDDIVEKSNKTDCVSVESSHPLYILYTSGSTGQPKGCVRDSGGYATVLKYSMKHFMGLEENSTYWAASDLGWVVGHSYICYGPLIHGCSTVLFEGKPILPDAGVLWRVVEDYKVNAIFTAPTAIRAIKKVDPHLNELGKYDISSLKTLFLAGERADPTSVRFFSDKLGVPVVDHWWQTELGNVGIGYETHGVRPGSAGLPAPGYDVHILDENSSEKKGPNELGEICIKLPLAPGFMLTLYNADDRFESTYFSKHPGYYSTGDSGFYDDDGYFHIMARTDDVVNTAGHRLSSGAMEEVLLTHSSVVECAVVGAHDEEKGQIPVGLVVLNHAADDEETSQIEKELIQLVRDEIGPVASFKHVYAVDMLPKTRSGKIMRGLLLRMCDGLPIAIPGTIEDAAAIAVCSDTIEKRWREVKTS